MCMCVCVCVCVCVYVCVCVWVCETFLLILQHYLLYTLFCLKLNRMSSCWIAICAQYFETINSFKIIF